MIFLLDGQLIYITNGHVLPSSMFCKILHLVLLCLTQSCEIARNFQEFKFGEQLNRRARCKASL